MTHTLDRRHMLKSSAALLAAGVWTHRAEGNDATSPNEKLNLAVIGLGGQGSHNLKAAAAQNIVALCDVDDLRAGKAYEQFPQATKFVDFRKMFDAMEKQIDGVVVSTPDHTHFHPAWWALERSKHLYLEKPLGHSVWETRKITELAREKKVATQLGMQRHALPSLRNGVELARSGVLGTITEVHCWVEGDRGMPTLSPNTQPTPTHLNWDLWLGPAKERPYNDAYVPYKWRFWWDFGTGETGNFGCHTLDIPFWALGLSHPTRVESVGGEWNEQTTPKNMSCKYHFPANGDRGPVVVHWHHGTPAIAKELGNMPRGTNTVIIGSEGKLLCGYDNWKLLPEDKFADAIVPHTFAASPGFHQEWFNAARGGEAATCNFDYSGPISETVLLGNVAFRARGAFDWDYKTLKPSGNNDAEQYLKSYFRKGWEV